MLKINKNGSKADFCINKETCETILFYANTEGAMILKGEEVIVPMDSLYFEDEVYEIFLRMKEELMQKSVDK